MVENQLTKNFHIREFKCKDGTEVPEKYKLNVLKLAQNLQIIRDDLNNNRPKVAPVGVPITLSINSGYRTPDYNKSVGGEDESKHLIAQAGDVACKWEGPKQLALRVERLINEGRILQGGLGRYPGFTHYDVRGTKARWDKTKPK